MTVCYATLVPSLRIAVVPGSASGTAPEPPSVQSPFACFRCYRPQRDVTHPFGERYLPVFAPTGSCASPRLSDRLRSSLGRPVFAGCRQPRLRRGPSRRSSVNLSSDAWTPAPVVVTVLVLVTSRDASAFPTLEQVGYPPLSRTATSVRQHISGLQSFATLQASGFACPPDRSHRRDDTLGGRGVDARAHRMPLPA